MGGWENHTYAVHVSTYRVQSFPAWEVPTELEAKVIREWSMSGRWGKRKDSHLIHHFVQKTVKVEQNK